MNKEVKQLNRKTNFTNDSFEVIKLLLYINQCEALLYELGFLTEKSKSNYYSELPQ